MGNRQVLQSFQNALADHLDVLRSTIVTSISQQQLQFTSMEEQVDGILTNKDKVSAISFGL